MVQQSIIGTVLGNMWHELILRNKEKKVWEGIKLELDRKSWRSQRRPDLHHGQVCLH